MTGTGRAVVVAVLLGLGASAHGSFGAEDAKAEADLKKMQGTWVRVGDDGITARWVIEGRTLKATVNETDYTCTLSLDPAARPHAAVDIAVNDGAGAGKTSKGIYKFDGDRLVFCVNVPGAGDRPTEFQTVEDQAFLFVMKPGG